MPGAKRDSRKRDDTPFLRLLGDGYDLGVEAGGGWGLRVQLCKGQEGSGVAHADPTGEKSRFSRMFVAQT